MAKVNALRRGRKGVANGAALAPPGQHRMLRIGHAHSPRYRPGAAQSSVDEPAPELMMCAGCRIRQASPPGLRADCCGSAAPSSTACCRRAALSCGETVADPDALCARCWRGMTFFAPPWCVACGVPFPHPMGEDAVCGECARERRSWDRARAVLRYDKHSRRLVLGLEAWRPHPCGARRSGAGCTAPGARSWREPISSSRCRCIGPGCSSGATTRRRCLAQAIRSAGGPPVAADWLVRRRRTPMQGHLGPAARERNVRGAFAMRARPQLCRKAGRHHRRCHDDRRHGRGVRPCAETRRGRLGRGVDIGAGVAGRRIDARLGTRGVVALN